jgi:hypothetical protein
MPWLLVAAAFFGVCYSDISKVREEDTVGWAICGSKKRRRDGLQSSKARCVFYEFV